MSRSTLAVIVCAAAFIVATRVVFSVGDTIPEHTYGAWEALGDATVAVLWFLVGWRGGYLDGKAKR